MGVYVFAVDVLIRTLITNRRNGSAFDFGHHFHPLADPSAHTLYAYDFRDETKNSARSARHRNTG